MDKKIIPTRLQPSFVVTPTTESQTNPMPDFLDAGESVFIKPERKQIMATLNTCVELIIYNKEKQPVAAIHLDSANFHKTDLSQITDFIAPGNFFLIVQGPVDDFGFGKTYIDKLRTHLINDKKIDEANIYPYSSDDYEEHKDMDVTWATILEEGSILLEHRDTKLNILKSENIKLD